MLATAIVLSLAGCGGSASTEPAPAEPAAAAAAPAGPSAEELALASADRLLDDAQTTLHARMVQRMNHRDPEDEVLGCSVETDALTALPPGSGHTRVGWSSLRLRNPANAPPDWVGAWLSAQGERDAAGVEGFARIEPSGEGSVARVLRPIAIDQRCLACHGPEDTLQADVRATLRQQFPDDRATGYALGDLRGALWAEVKVTR